MGESEGGLCYHFGHQSDKVGLTKKGICNHLIEADTEIMYGLSMNWKRPQQVPKFGIYREAKDVVFSLQGGDFIDFI